ncbi:MAG TPA: PLP-dependent aminotransferase family protein [Caldisericia bacterium]|nr:PLP-dependent aminotransferase family protein [Caldisericia bacterium]HPF48658.1 PLP-dependent aminotransferase family protein [Caldisericia bacterium]HPI83682.1 PLP-dependent aminotransferase family protein [Caldisericia bacterium]HPQ93113.1 PLP-dependent aminotransferase family protein [Caldisericia bacterium]HRV75054.1 PLP-dependent aminotransferase family protein [Caldisericia bacterium]
MYIPIDRKSGKKLSDQVVDGIMKLVADGFLPLGSQLPSTRDLANSLGVNRNTVVAAYDLLVEKGITEAKVGLGTVVIRDVKGTHSSSMSHTFPWTESFVGNVPHYKRFFLPQSETDKPISMLRGYGYIDPLCKQFVKTVSRQARKSGAKLLGLIDLRGHPDLVTEITRRVALDGVDMENRGVIVTPGGTAANTLVLSMLLKQGDSVIVERPTYFQTIRWLQWNKCRVFEAPMTRAGVDLDAVESLIVTKKPKLIYTIPTAHNPTGVTTSVEHRKRLLSIATKHNVPILEDDYLFGGFIGNIKPPNLAVWDKAGIVVTTSSFSKLTGQGLRLGFVCAPNRVITQLEQMHCYTLGPQSHMCQEAFAEVLASPSFDRHIETWSKSIMRKKQIFLKKLFEESTGRINVWDSNAMTLWIETPGITGEDLTANAAAFGLLVLPGSLFVPEGINVKAIRVSLTEEDTEQLIEGAKILAKVLKVRKRVSNESSF